MFVIESVWIKGHPPEHVYGFFSHGGVPNSVHINLYTHTRMHTYTYNIYIHLRMYVHG